MTPSHVRYRAALLPAQLFKNATPNQRSGLLPEKPGRKYNSRFLLQQHVALKTAFDFLLMTFYFLLTQICCNQSQKLTPCFVLQELAAEG